MGEDVDDSDKELLFFLSCPVFLAPAPAPAPNNMSDASLTVHGLEGGTVYTVGACR